MGTPDFAVESLKTLVESGVDVAAVVTAPDRPAGRGQKLNPSAVKIYAVQKELQVLQPENLKDPLFISQLQHINASLFVVVAFRMLPEAVWKMPPRGTINLHASLLPDYRGAAPINWAVINGEKKTGATTFFLKHEIDTGDVIDQIEVEIKPDDTAGDVHNKLMLEGAGLLLRTVNQILNGEVNTTPQTALVVGAVKEAPKIFKQDCKIDWTQTTQSIYNKIRGLSPYPAAWTEISKDVERRTIKIFDSIAHFDGVNHAQEIKVDQDKLYFGTGDGWIEILQIQAEGKRRMSVSDFLKGFQITHWILH